MAFIQPSDKIIKRLADEIEAAGTQGLIPSSDALAISSALRNQLSPAAVELVIPNKVTCNYYSRLADLRLVRCTRQGHVESIQKHPDIIKEGRCPNSNCRGSTVPAPVWIISGGRFPQQTFYTTSGIPLVISLESYAGARNLGAPMKVVIKNKARPIATLTLETRKCKDHRLQYTHRYGRFEYLLAMTPSESITKPLSITAFAYNPKHCFEIETTLGNLNGIEKLLFCEKLEVLQATIAYRAGHPRASSKGRVVVFEFDQAPYSGVYTYKLYVRYIVTQGLVTKVDANAVRNLQVGGKNPMWVVLHTLSHAFLVRLPQVTGLESRDFAEALSVHHNEFAVFDNSPGGLGGILGVVDMKAKTLNPNYEYAIRDSYKCPLECIRACKACLFTDSCYMLNWNLNRHLLKELKW